MQPLPKIEQITVKYTQPFPEAFKTLTGNFPFPWQEEMFLHFTRGTIPSSCDLPTGLGKTSVLAIWLIARASGAPVPRRLAYVVDRRAVVDQATTEAMNLGDAVKRDPNLKKALGLSDSLPVSTLRGQYLDNRDWLGDPASPAIIVGTVDMIGSRLLFEGYGVGRKMRPFHAGLLGCDTLVVIDEAHLVPPFEELIKTIAHTTGDLSPQTETLRQLVPSFRLLSLSATSRGSEQTFGLTDADLRLDTITYQRLTARKRLTLNALLEDETLPEALARWAWTLTSRGKEAKKIIVFSDKREVAQKAHDQIIKLAKGDKKAGIAEVKIQQQLLVGARRVREREDVSKWLIEYGFLGGSELIPSNPTFVFATSAGEVGIDLDADHLVCDLVAWERMTQRLGRVNRRGKGDAKIIVVKEPDRKPSKAAENALKKSTGEHDDKDKAAIADHKEKTEKARALAKPFDLLPTDDEGIDVSPNALRQLKLSARPAVENESFLEASERERRREILEQATSTEPLRPALTRSLVDAWSMTSLREHTGRPRIQPWLRGWVDAEPQTTILWRTFFPVSRDDIVSSASTNSQIEAFFDAAPPHVSETLETETTKVIAWLEKRAESLVKSAKNEAAVHQIQTDDPCAVILTRDGELRRRPLKITDFLFPADDKKAAKKKEDALFSLLVDGTLILDARFAGLDSSGLLSDSAADIPSTLDGSPDWLPASGSQPAIRFRVRKFAADDEPADRDTNWQPRFTCPLEHSMEGESQNFLVVEKWRGVIETADDATGPALQGLDQHQNLTKQKATVLAQRLGLPKEYVVMLEIAARLHDEGKRHTQWQDAFNAPLEQRPYAKTKGPINQAILAGYRHEFASLDVVAKDRAFMALPVALQDLALHLVAAHHGFARPVITTRGYPDVPPSLLENRAREVATRFIRLQRQWGPWGLAWWESLLRAADHQSSSEASPSLEIAAPITAHV